MSIREVISNGARLFAATNRQIFFVMFLSTTISRLCNFQVDGIYNDVSGYAGCQGQGFRQGSVIFLFEITIVYQVTVSLPATVRTILKYLSVHTQKK